MSDEIRDLTTIAFSGQRFDDAGLELDVLSELLAYRKLLIETAKELWRSENPVRQRLPKGFEDSIGLRHPRPGVSMCRLEAGVAAGWKPALRTLPSAASFVNDVTASPSINVVTVGSTPSGTSFARSPSC